MLQECRPDQSEQWLCARVSESEFTTEIQNPEPVVGKSAELIDVPPFSFLSLSLRSASSFSSDSFRWATLPLDVLFLV